ncbi:NAD(P)/FAD-dependent oxidoreductase [Helicobacter jaachi]|uniref:NAD(P)/FAD-dependent oxidoreductase n=1 Tax=Helicobacter jaachi TaxID=1677920 RepID=A0A4V6I2S1_9HELI|nr:NAD(P)/FAD-dependent oxidoreductase [Helicobacter jaachi]TLD97222.1 NAD(P)/FAD-dependent oxidoreductase [Helicobacter jaachi]
MKPKILIIGGGYGGLRTAITLQNATCLNADITLISKHDYHYQTTLLHKVAIGTLSARKARIYFRKILDLSKVRFIKDKIHTFEPEHNRVKGNGGVYEYDYLVIALGFKPDDFGIKGVDKYAYKISSLNAALKLDKNIEYKFKEYCHTKNANDLSIIVCGTGFTGIEFAAELGSRLDELCLISGIPRDVPKVTCIGRSDRILPMFSKKASAKAQKKLEAFGVKVICNGDVQECRKDGVVIKHNGKLAFIEGNTILWSAGVRGNDKLEESSLHTTKGRIKVDEYLRCPQYKNIYVVGDCALYASRDAIHAPTAQLAAQMGDYVAKSLIKILHNKPQKQIFRFKHRGTVCSIGHTDGVGIIYKKGISGEFAAFLKNFIENKWLFGIGGAKLVFKNGQFRYRTSN